MSVSIPQHSWIVVADGHSARVLENEGQQGALELKEIHNVTPQNLLSEGPSGSRPQDDSPRDTDEATFAKQLSHWLTEHALKKSFAHLVLVADPKTLGQMRPQLHKEVTDRIVHELPKTLTGASLDDIARSINAI